MAELLAKEPLFNGKTEFEQLDKVLHLSYVCFPCMFHSAYSSMLLIAVAANIDMYSMIAYGEATFLVDI